MNIDVIIIIINWMTIYYYYLFFHHIIDLRFPLGMFSDFSQRHYDWWWWWWCCWYLLIRLMMPPMAAAFHYAFHYYLFFIYAAPAALRCRQRAIIAADYHRLMIIFHYWLINDWFSPMIRWRWLFIYFHRCVISSRFSFSLITPLYIFILNNIY